MGINTAEHDEATYFAHVVTAMKSAGLRPHISLSEVPAPRRIAPYAIAFSAEVSDPSSDDIVGTGRFVVLYDPAGQDAWDGAWRVVTFARAELESEVAADPLLGEVGWAWLLEALEDAQATYTGETGTVTRVVNESFGQMAERPSSVELEVRASWTPLSDDLASHMRAWGELMCTIAGVPPVVEGVTPLPRRA